MAEGVLRVGLAIPLLLAACGGRTVDRESGGAECAQGTVELAMRAPPGAASSWCIGAPNACSHQWLQIFGPDGVELVVDRPCVASCGDCEPVGCPALCAAPTRMHEQGVTRTWDGSYFAAAACGGGMACVAPRCSPPGRYTARMCAYRDHETDEHAEWCSPTSEPTCESVAFDWPPGAGAGVVEATIRGPHVD
jgi:hypothetical protein